MTKIIQFPSLDSQYQGQLYTSIAEVNASEWDQIIGSNNDLAMKRELILLTETSLIDQAKFWVVVIRYNQQPVACACLSLFRTDTMQSAPAAIQRTMQRLRKYKPNLLKLGVLFCGLPVPCAHSHVRFTAATHVSPSLQLLNKIMQQLAQQEKASLIVFKELDQDQLKQCESLQQQLGFIQGPVAPMHELAGHFNDFDHYQKALRANYRRQVKQTMDKFVHANMSIQHISDPELIEQQFTDEVYQLYVAVWQRSNERLEQFPAHFFRNLGYTLPGQTLLTLVHQQDKPVAFAIGIRSQDNYYNLYCGLDYSIKQESDLYFNLYYHELDNAFKQNMQTIFLGQTSDHFKSRLGSTATPRYFLVRAKKPLPHLGLKLFNRFIFPTPPAIVQRQVFKTDSHNQVK